MRQIGRNCAPNLPCENVRSFRFFSAETTDVAPAALPLHFPTHARTERGKEIKKRRNSKNMKHVAKTCVKRQDHLAVTYSPDNDI